MKQVTQCVNSEGFCNALFDAIIQNETTQFVLSNQNLQALRAPIPPGANVVASVSGDRGIQIGLLVRPVWFNCSYDLRPLTPDMLRNLTIPRMQAVTQCVTNEGFVNGLQAIMSLSNTSTAQVQAILGIANLHALGVPIPPGCTWSVECRTDMGPFCLTLVVWPITVNFVYQN